MAERRCLRASVLAAYLGALINNYSTPHYYERVRSGPAPRRPGRLLDKELLDAQIDKRREHGRVVEVQRRILIGKEKTILRILQGQQINTAYVERDNLTRAPKQRTVSAQNPFSFEEGLLPPASSRTGGCNL